MVWIIVGVVVALVVLALVWRSSGKAPLLGNPRRAHDDPAIGEARSEVYRRNMTGNGPGAF
ncbi:MAG: hypothetical protein ACTHNS_04710 [Marmoricola sp.]